MKKTLLALSLVLALGVGSMAVFANASAPEAITPETRFPGVTYENMSEQEREEWFNERNEYRNEYRQENLKEALKDGKITEAQAKEWEEHFEYMDEFHQENGYMSGGCGNGNGMMRGNSNNSNNSNSNSNNSNSNGHGGMMRGNGHGGMMRGNRF